MRESESHAGFSLFLYARLSFRSSGTVRSFETGLQAIRIRLNFTNVKVNSWRQSYENIYRRRYRPGR